MHTTRPVSKDTAAKHYLALAETTVLLLKVQADTRNVTLFDHTDRILKLGLGAVGERYTQDFISETVGKAPGRFRYVLARKAKKYLVVSEEVHKKVNDFARARGIRQIDATRVLIGLGEELDQVGDPRRHSRYGEWQLLKSRIPAQWEEMNPGHSFWLEGGQFYLDQQEARVLRSIMFGRRTRRQNSAEDYRQLIQALNTLREENRRLKKENEDLRRRLQARQPGRPKRARGHEL